MTPLWDSMGILLKELEDEVTEEDLVLVTVITDGYENSSVRYNADKIRRLVTRLDEKGWIFTYIGANQDASEAAGEMGIKNFLEFDFSKNMYLMSIVATACLLAIISMSWIRLLNCKLMRTDLVEPIKPVSKQAEPNSIITLADVEMCIKKEGYVPQAEEDRIIFKIAGERYDVYYQDEKFTLIKRFGLSEDVDKDLVLKACAQTHDEIFMFRSYTHTYDTNTTVLCFEVETYVSTLSELERYFPQYLNVINHAIERQREIYQQMLEESNPQEEDKSGSGAVEHKVVS